MARIKRVINPNHQIAIRDQELFLAPLSDPVIGSIILAHGVDAGITKYTVPRLLRIYIFAGLLSGVFDSLRGIASLCDNYLAPRFVGIPNWTRSGLSDANKRVPYTVYKEIFEKLSEQINCRFSKPQIDQKFGKFQIFDSTCLQLCLKLIPWGKPQNQRSKKGQMKLTIRLDDGGMIPVHVVINSDPCHEDTVFEAMIDWSKSSYTYLFDRGYRRIETMVKIHQSDNFFITRWNQSVGLTVVKNLPLCRERRGEIEIINDQKVRLGKTKKTKAGVCFRLITAISYREKEPKTLYFLTNRFDLCPFDVADIYRYRWQIEVFFKWLKSQLNINHFFTYSENGIYSQIYITLIFNLLLAIYHENLKTNARLGINTKRALINDLINFAIEYGFMVGYALCAELLNEDEPPGKLENHSFHLKKLGGWVGGSE